MTAVVTGKSDLRAVLAGHRAEGKRIALVPTMGALHDGHLSLVRAAAGLADLVVTSVFVNPTQFAPGEDFERYPRDLDADVALLTSTGADIVFAPSTAEMYGVDSGTTVTPGPVALRWEGEVRPGHFEGVALIVTKLLSLVRPDVALFGEKDYQQLKVIECLARELDLGIDIVGCPIVRDADGLALSSRNAYLSTHERAIALALSGALRAVRASFSAGERDGEALVSVMREAIERIAGDDLRLDYLAVVEPHTLEPASVATASSRALLAGRVGTTRLIDNAPLGEGADL